MVMANKISKWFILGLITVGVLLTFGAVGYMLYDMGVYSFYVVVILLLCVGIGYLIDKYILH